MEELKNRKTIRLQGADYNSIGAYFLTICTQDRKCILSRIIVGTGVPDGSCSDLTPYGKIADKYIRQLNDFYSNISVEGYVIMPNHIHIMLCIHAITDAGENIGGNNTGPSRTPVPTAQNSIVSRFISTFKRFCNKEYGQNIWQYRSYDHIIRNQRDYEDHMKYIEENPIRWYYDELYSEE